jgi:hypothetical protein
MSEEKTIFGGGSSHYPDITKETSKKVSDVEDKEHDRLIIRVKNKILDAQDAGLIAVANTKLFFDYVQHKATKEVRHPL